MFNERLKTSPANFTLYPLLLLAVCFTLGIAAAEFLFFGWQVYLISCLVFAILTILFINRKPALIFLSIAFVFAGSLFFTIENQSIAENRVKLLYNNQQIKSDDPIEITGILQSKPELAAGGFFLELKTEKAVYKGEQLEISGKVRLFAPVVDEQIREEYKKLNLQYGSIINVACRLRREDNFLNAGVSSQTEILDQNEIDATAIVKSPLLIEKIGESKVFAPVGWLYNARENLIVNFKDNFNVSTAGVLIASLLGNQYFLDSRTAEVFRDGGTFHVLVISGLHITFIGGLALLLVRLFTRRKLWQFTIACAFLWLFSIAVGAQVPVVRAALMFTILLFPEVIYRQGTLLNSLGACALILLVWRPDDLFSQSLQLTFVSVGSLIVLAFPLVEKLRAIGDWTLTSETPVPPQVGARLKRFCETLYWRETVWQIESARNVWTANLFKNSFIKWNEHSVLQRILQFIFESLLVSAIVQISLLPLMVIYFHRVSFAGIFLNLWVGVIIAFESFAAILAVIFGQISRAFSFPFIKITEFFNWLLVAFPGVFTENGWASFRVPHYSGVGRAIYFLYFIPLLALAFWLYDWNPAALNFKSRSLKLKRKTLSVSITVLSILIGLIIFHPFSAPPPDGRLQVDFLDVGQGDSSLITFPDGETMLVDGGGKIDFKSQWIKREDDEPELFEPDTQGIGETVVSKFLWEKGYDRIDYILATHADADHIQGLKDVAENFRVRAALFGRMPFGDKEFAAVYEVLQKRGVPVVILSRGDLLDFSGVKVEVLNPEKDDSPQPLSDNNHSVVLRLIYGDRKFLLTGDIEKETESELLSAPEFVKTDVLKVAHHGSRTSSTQEFVGAAGVKLAVISVGKQSPFGHPHREVVERLENSGAKVLTTGKRGTISVSTDGKDLQLKTFQR